MAQDEGKQEEEKFDFDSQGEAQVYISLPQATLLAIQTATDTPGAYGRRFRRIPMAYEPVESTEDEDYYVITLSFRPQGTFAGTPGREQFFIGKEGLLAHRQVLAVPLADHRRHFSGVIIATGLTLVIIAAVVGTVLVIRDTGGQDKGNSTSSVLVQTSTPTNTQIPLTSTSNSSVPTETKAPTLIPVPTTTSQPTTTSISPAAASSDGDLRVLQFSAVGSFPDGIKFSIAAESIDEIDFVRVFARKIGLEGVTSYIPTEFEPGKKILAEAVLTSGEGSYFPPGTQIEYSIEIRDKAGRVMRTSPQEITYLDSRFDWNTIEEALITVYYDGEKGEQYGRELLVAVQDSQKRLQPVLGISVTRPLRIVTYNNASEMLAVLPFRSQSTVEQVVTVSMAFTDESVLLVAGISVNALADNIAFSLTRMMVELAAGDAIAQVPEWLGVGLAVHISSIGAYDTAFRSGLSSNTFRPLWLLARFPGHSDEVYLAHGQSSSVVQFLIDTYGTESMANLF